MKKEKFHRFAWVMGMPITVMFACQGIGSTSGITNSSAPGNPPGSVTGNPSPGAASSDVPASLPATRLDQASDVDSSSQATAKSVTGGVPL
ncbi:MAG TPA: hypothetical protein VLX61_03160 [Anaerolineales bacterium]|nr:hypothetical protein [Anaerolineales bacterium]